MTLRRQSTKLGSSTFMAAIVFAVGLHAAAPGAYAEETAATEAKSDFIPDADRTANRPPATFFTINQVLAKLDRERGKGAGATRLAALDAVQRRDRRAAHGRSAAGRQGALRAFCLPCAGGNLVAQVARH